jgi:hypothetical protein
LLAAVPPLDLLTVPLSGLAVLLGAIGLARAPAASGRSFVPGLAGMLVGLPVLVLSLFWPDLLNPAHSALWGAARPDAAQPLAVPIHRGKGEVVVAPETPEWIDASTEAVEQGDLRVRVLSATVRPPDFKDATRKRGTRERCLLVAVRVYNVGAERRFEYVSWGNDEPGSREQSLLSDSLGNEYRLRTFADGAEVTGHLHRATLSPGGHVDDVLVFEPVPTSVEYLRLGLPAGTCGGTGTLKVQIPRSMIVYR